MDKTAKQKVDEALDKLISGEIDWEEFEKVVDDACGPRPKMEVKITYGGGINSIKIINGDES